MMLCVGGGCHATRFIRWWNFQELFLRRMSAEMNECQNGIEKCYNLRILYYTRSYIYLNSLATDIKT